MKKNFFGVLRFLYLHNTLHNTGRNAMVQIARIAVTMFLVAVAAFGQERIMPNKKEDSTARRLIMENYFPDEPRGVLTDPWDSIYARVDKYTRVFKPKVPHRAWFEPESSRPLLGIRYGSCVVAGVMDGSPAYRSGIAIGDSIVAVNGTVTLGKDSIAMSAIEAIEDEDTVRLEMNRPGKRYTAKMVRAEFKQRSVFSMRNGRTAFVRIVRFGEGAHDDFEEQVGRLGYQAIDSIIIDLRGNPGGSVWETMRILESFCVDGDTLFKEVSRKDTTYKIAKGGKHPLQSVKNIAVLVDSMSASASEALAGCLRVRRSARILGTKTFGKGVVQREFRLLDNDMRVTISEYFAGGVTKVHRVGLMPDGAVPLIYVREKSRIGVGSMDLAEVRRKYPYPHEIALAELGLDWSKAHYIWGDAADAYYVPVDAMKKKIAKR